MTAGAARPPARRFLIRLAHAAGYLLVALSIVYLADRWVQSGVWHLARDRGPSLMAAIAAGAVGYGLASFLMSVAWVRIVRWCGQPDAGWRAGLTVYGRSQIAKYLPGNVFHFVGRHVGGRRQGFDHVPMVWSALTEAAGLVSVAAALALVGSALWLPVGPGLSVAALALVAVLAALSPIVLSRAFAWIGRRMGIPIRDRGIRDIVTGLLPAFLLYALFFALSAAILWGLSAVLTPPRLSVLAMLVPVLAAAWLAGYVTPGAAAGLGIREAVLVAALSGPLGAADAALLAISYRGVTLLGDGVFFAVSSLIAAPAGPVADQPTGSG